MKARKFVLNKNELRQTNIGQNRVEADKSRKIVEFGWQIKEQFEKDHLQGSIYIDCQELQNSPEWLLKPDQEIYNVFKAHFKSEESNGFLKEQNIFVYNRYVRQMSILPACRLAILILHFNVSQSVDILLGGYESYLCSQSQSVEIIRVFREKSNQLSNEKAENKLIIGYEELEKYKDYQLVDTRTKQEYEGLISGYDYWDKKGNIPNSIFHGGTISKTSCQVKQYSPRGQFLKMWQEQGIDIKKHIVLYCGTGWRASEIMVYAFLNGVSSLSLYSNGWVQWSKKNYKITQIGQIKNKKEDVQKKCIKKMINKQIEVEDKTEGQIKSCKNLKTS